MLALAQVLVLCFLTPCFALPDPNAATGNNPQVDTGAQPLPGDPLQPGTDIVKPRNHRQSAGRDAHALSDQNRAATPVDPRRNAIQPEATLLLQNAPNPSTNYTTIAFFLKKPGPASLKLYTISGELIGYFFDGFMISGWYSEGFNTNFLAKGEYIYRLKTPEAILMRKMLVVR
jgi:hypothetical protein